MFNMSAAISSISGPAKHPGNPCNKETRSTSPRRHAVNWLYVLDCSRQHCAAPPSFRALPPHLRRASTTSPELHFGKKLREDVTKWNDLVKPTFSPFDQHNLWSSVQRRVIIIFGRDGRDLSMRILSTYDWNHGDDSLLTCTYSAHPARTSPVTWPSLKDPCPDPSLPLRRLLHEIFQRLAKPIARRSKSCGLCSQGGER